MDVGQIRGQLLAVFDDRGFQRFDKAMSGARADASKAIRAQPGGNFNDAAFKRYEQALDRAQRRTRDREIFKAQLGASFSPTAFNQYERAIDRAGQASRRGERDLGRLGGVMRSLVRDSVRLSVIGIGAQALSALGAAGAAAVAGLSPLSGLLAAYPALATAGAQAAGTWALAFSGVSTAVGGLNQKLDKNSKAFRELTPEGKRFAEQLERMKQPLRDLSQTAQRGLLPGLSAGIKSAMSNFDVLKRGVSDTSRVIGGLARQAGDLLGSKAFGRDLSTQMSRNDVTIRRLGQSGLYLADALRHVVLAAGPLVGWLTRSTLALSRNVDQWAKSARESGQFARFFMQTRQVMSDVAHIAANLGVALVNVFRGAYPTGRSLLDILVRLTGQFREWTGSAAGQNRIRRYFEDTRPAMIEAGRLVGALVNAFGQLGSGRQVAPLLRTIRTELLPAFTRLVNSTTQAFAPAFITAAKNMLLVFSQIGGSSGPLVAVVRLVGTLAGALNSLLQRVPGLAPLISAFIALAGILRAMKFVAAITGISTLVGGVKSLGGESGKAAGEAGKLGGVLGKLRVAGGIIGGIVSLGLAIRGLVHHGISAQEVTAKLSPQIRKLADAGNIAGLRNLSRRFSDWSGQLKDVDKNASRTFARLAGQATSAANRINRIKWDFAERLGGALLKGRSLTSRTVRDILDQFLRLQPNIRDDTAKAMIAMTSRLEQAGRVARGTTTKLVNDLLGQYDKLHNQGGKSFQALMRDASDHMTELKRRSKTTTGRMHKEVQDEIDQLKRGVGRSFDQMKGHIDDVMPKLAAGVIGGSKDAQKKASAEWFNFQFNVNWAMQHGLLATKKGGELLRQEGQNLLKIFGSLTKIPFPVAVDNLPAAPSGPHGHTGAARGALVQFGRAGQKGRDAIPVNMGGVNIMVGAGEKGAVFTGEQQQIADYFLAPVGGLRGLFSRFRRPHYMAQGGLVPNLYGHPGNITGSLRNLISTMEQHFPALMVTATTDGSHVAGSYHYKGEAADMAADSSTMFRAADWVKRSGLYRSLAEGIHNPNLAVKFGQLFSGAGPFGAVWAGHANHIHLAITGALGAVMQQLKVPTIKGRGPIADMVRSILGKATKAANQFVGAHAFPAGAGSSVPGIMQIAMTAAAAAGVPFNAAIVSELLSKESSGGQNLPPSGPLSATGPFQVIPSTFAAYEAPGHGDIRNPLDNALAAFRYIKARYGTLANLASTTGLFTGGYHGYGRGGFVDDAGGDDVAGFDQGGFVDPSGAVFGPRLHARRPHHRETWEERLLGIPRLPREPRPVQTTGPAGALARRISGNRHLITSLEQEVGTLDSFYGINVPDLVDPDTGQVNTAAVKTRVAEYDRMIAIRRRIFRTWQRVIEQTDRLTASYRLIIRRLRAGLASITTKGLKGKALASAKHRQQRTRTLLASYRGKLSTAAGDLQSAGDDRDSAWIDLLSLKNERAGVAGTKPEPETGGGGPTPQDLAAAALEQVNAFQASRSDLFAGFGTNLVAAGTNPFATPTGQAAGLRYFGGGGMVDNSRSVNIENHYAIGPEDPHQWAHGQRFAAETAFG